MIPAYNNPALLACSLETVSAQDQGPERMQIEVVDDASSTGDLAAVVDDIGRGGSGTSATAETSDLRRTSRRAFSAWMACGSTSSTATTCCLTASTRPTSVESRSARTPSWWPDAATLMRRSGGPFPYNSLAADRKRVRTRCRIRVCLSEPDPVRYNRGGVLRLRAGWRLRQEALPRRRLGDVDPPVVPRSCRVGGGTAGLVRMHAASDTARLHRSTSYLRDCRLAGRIIAEEFADPMARRRVQCRRSAAGSPATGWTWRTNFWQQASGDSLPPTPCKRPRRCPPWRERATPAGDSGRDAWSPPGGPGEAPRC